MVRCYLYTQKSTKDGYNVKRTAAASYSCEINKITLLTTEKMQCIPPILAVTKISYLIFERRIFLTKEYTNKPKESRKTEITKLKGKPGNVTNITISCRFPMLQQCHTYVSYFLMHSPIERFFGSSYSRKARTGHLHLHEAEFPHSSNSMSSFHIP